MKLLVVADLAATRVDRGGGALSAELRNWLEFGV